MEKIKYQFWATLFDSFETYLYPERTWQKYWGNSDNPSKTEDEFAEQSEVDLMNCINKVKFTSEPASKGTAFNNLVDWWIHDREKLTSSQIEDVKMLSVGKELWFEHLIDGFLFRFPVGLVSEVAEWYIDNTFGSPMLPCSQVYTDGIIHTAYGNVKLYGYIDELMPLDICDIKTTGQYSMGQFKHHWQHLIYPYCVRCHGGEPQNFSYDIIAWKKNYGAGKAPWTECKAAGLYHEKFCYVPERDDDILRRRCEQIIEYIERKRDVITNKKIFNLENNA